MHPSLKKRIQRDPHHRRTRPAGGIRHSYLLERHSRVPGWPLLMSFRRAGSSAWAHKTVLAFLVAKFPQTSVIGTGHCARVGVMTDQHAAAAKSRLSTTRSATFIPPRPSASGTGSVPKRFVALGCDRGSASSICVAAPARPHLLPRELSDLLARARPSISLLASSS